MTYEETKNLMMECYPSLFVDELDVLDHLFFVIGTEYDWEGGELTSGKTADQYRAEAKESDEWCAKNFPQQVRPKDPVAARAETLEQRKRWIATDPSITGMFLLPDGRMGRTIYPLCEYSKIVSIPKNIKPDWLEAAQRAFQLAHSERCRRTKRDDRWLKKARPNVFR